MAQPDRLLHLLRRFAEEGVQYVLVGGHAVRLNGQTFESLQPHLRKIEIEGVPIATLDIDGLLKTKTDYREKDLIDKSVLTKLKNALK